jgi:hypothetical protein
MLEKKYIRYYLSGYLNTYSSSLAFSYDPSSGSYKQFKINKTLRYTGIKEIKKDFSFLTPLICLVEAIMSTIIVSARFLYTAGKIAFVRKRTYNEQIFVASLIIAPFRLKGMLNLIRPKEVCTLKIPFIKNEYSENEVDILTVLSIGDICKAFAYSFRTIWIQYHKYRSRDLLFRSYSSFEYYLTCAFVSKMDANNSFLFYNTYDRWAFLMCNTSKSIFIQHGKLSESLRIIKIGTPKTAYYITKKQGLVLEKVLFKGIPEERGYRNALSFTSNDLLLNNGKKNVLLVCWSHNIALEWEICKLLNPLCNLYIKPHPGDKDNPDYPLMSEKYNAIIIPKTGYPQVDVVVSYDSTLADEYENVDIKVIRYDLLDNLNDIVNKL